MKRITDHAAKFAAACGPLVGRSPSKKCLTKACLDLKHGPERLAVIGFQWYVCSVEVVQYSWSASSGDQRSVRCADSLFTDKDPLFAGILHPQLCSSSERSPDVSALTTYDKNRILARHRLLDPTVC